MTGGVTPHFIAGYGGGGKSILPGIAARDTINTNHNLALNPGIGQGIHPKSHSGSYLENPMRIDIDEATALAKPDFMINVVADSNNRVVKAFAGHYKKAFQQAIYFAESLCTVHVPHKFDFVIVSAGGYPRDINLRQATKALHHALRVANPGATVILLAECPDEFGDAQCREQIVDLPNMQVRELALRKNFTIGAFVGYYFASLSEEYRIILVSAMRKELFASTKIHVAASVDESLAIARQLNGGQLDMPAIVLPNGGCTLPKVDGDCAS